MYMPDNVMTLNPLWTHLFLLSFRDAPVYSPSTGHLPGSCQGSINFGRSQKTACHPACGVDADATARRSVGLAAIRTNRQKTEIDRCRNGVEALCGLGNRTTKKPGRCDGRTARFQKRTDRTGYRQYCEIFYADAAVQISQEISPKRSIAANPKTRKYHGLACTLRSRSGHHG